MKRLAMAIVVGLVMLSLLSVNDACAAGKVVSIEFVSAFAAQDRNTALFQEFGKLAETRTKGAVKVTVHPAGTLVPPKQVYDSVAKGIADMAWAPISYNPGRFPMTELLELPVGASDNVIFSKMANEFYKKFQPQELKDVKVLLLGQSPPYFIHTNKPVTKLEDLKGMKIKVTGSVQSDTVLAFGAVPVAMSAGEVYDSISKGVIDGFYGSYQVLETLRLNEVVKYTVENPQSSLGTCGILIVNKAKWNSLPPDIAKILEDIYVGELGAKFPATYAAESKHGKEYAIKGGLKVTTLSASEENRWIDRLKPLIEKNVKERASRGLQAQEGLSFIQNYLKAKQK